MELLDHLRRQFAYDDWANREVLRGLPACGITTGRPVQLMAHILSAERLWLERLQRQPQSLPVWPEFSLDECQAQAAELDRLWRLYLRQTSPSLLSEEIAYQNSKGEAWTSTVEDILTHVVMHSAYHRGQIASDMRAHGHTPAYTDFIHAVRQGLVEEAARSGKR
ncbi:MAG TPA: DinB family protein [Pyrinomonadaceae bacterium]|nr:DinB family protein [Pyrinomonadaceae bacterium]